MPYGTVLEPAQLAASPLPTPRGVLSEAVIDVLQRDPAHSRALLPHPTGGHDDPLYGDDSALALYCLYELHYRGFDGVDARWEWHPELLAVAAADGGTGRGTARGRGRRARRAPEDPRRRCTTSWTPPAVRSLSGYLLEKGTAEQVTEMAIHRSAYQLKEADPHTFAIPRLSGLPKAAAVEIQADEYGAGVARDMHQNLFGLTMTEIGLDPSYNAYLDVLPGSTLAGVNAVSMFGLHRRWLGACVGHLAMFEMTSVEPMGATAAALRRLGFGADARHFYSVHVAADAHHQHVAADQLARGLVEQDERYAPDVLFGAAAVMTLEGEAARRTLEAWDDGRSSLLTSDVLVA